jgi:hypothetical protein
LKITAEGFLTFATGIPSLPFEQISSPSGRATTSEVGSDSLNEEILKNKATFSQALTLVNN